MGVRSAEFWKRINPVILPALVGLMVVLQSFQIVIMAPTYYLGTRHEAVVLKQSSEEGDNYVKFRLPSGRTGEQHFTVNDAFRQAIKTNRVTVGVARDGRSEILSRNREILVWARFSVLLAVCWFFLRAWREEVRHAKNEPS